MHVVPMQVEPTIDKDAFRAVQRVLLPIVVSWMWMVPLIRMLGHIRQEEARGLRG